MIVSTTAHAGADVGISGLATTAAELACALDGKRMGPTQWIARCLYHDDRSPSLTIGEGEDRRVLVHCQAGCENVFGRLVADGYISGSSQRRSADEAEARFRYMDQTGMLAFEIVRLPGKQFRARRPTADGTWLSNVPDELRIPYRLPQVVSAPSDARILVVEGEKDADTLATLGYVATTNPFGAGKWRSQFNQYFRGRDVVIVPDNDEPGRKHAESVRQQLELAAASVRVLSLASVVAEKGDVSDLIGSGGIAAFERLLDQLPPPDFRHKPFLSIQDLAKLPRRQWLVDGLLPQQGFALLYGDSGVGKSFIAIDASVRIAAGERVLGRSAESGLVFYAALEGQSGLHDRIRGVCQEIGVIDENRLPLVVRTRSLDLLETDSVRDLISAVERATSERKTPVALIVIDTLSRAMAGRDENSPSDMGGAVQGMARIQHGTGAAVLVIHHSGKTVQKGARGHSSLRAAVDSELLVARDGSRRTLMVTKQRDGADTIEIPFELVTRSMPTDAEEVSSQTLVVRPAPSDDGSSGSGLKTVSQKALRALKDALRTSGRVLNAEEADAAQVPRGTRVVSRTEWLAACREAKISRGTDGAARKALSRASQELRQAGLLGEAGDLVWVVK